MTRRRSILTTLACLAGGAACAVCLGVGRAVAIPPTLNLSLDSAGNYRTANSTIWACRPADPKNAILQKKKEVFKPIGFQKAHRELRQQIQNLSKRIKRASGKKRKALLVSRSKRKATLSFISLCAARRLAAIQVTYDHEGVAHATGATDADAFTSLGYAHASHRLLQMVLRRLQVQGRLAEFLGARFGTGDTAFDALASDRKFRTLGYYRRAIATLGTLSPAHRQLLEAFTRGINRFILERPGQLPIALSRLGITVVEPWRPEDSLAIYAAMSSLFVGGGGETDNETRFLADVAEFGAEAAFERWLNPVRDDDAAIVKAPGTQLAHFDPSTLSAHIPSNMKASHNWVVAGDRLTTNRPLMVGLPMLKVDLRVLYPARISSPSFNVYGVGFAGTIGFLLGFTDHTSWAVTALSADGADEVRLTPAGPDHYLLDGVPVPYENRAETIRIKGESPLYLTVRTSHFGPIISDLAPHPTSDVIALRTVILYVAPDGRRDPIEGLLALMRARTVEQFRDAAWRILYPAVHMIFASDEGSSGSIAYMPVIGVPIRTAPLQGILPLDGSQRRHDWAGLLSKDRVPFLRDPVAGYIVTANDLATNDRSIYGYGGFGYSDRAWRLHRLIQAKLAGGQRIPADDISDLRFDCGHAVLESFLTLVEYMIATYPDFLPNLPVIKTALIYLRDTPDLALPRPYGPLARNLVKLLGSRFRGTPMESKYGPSTPGLIHLLRLFELDSNEVNSPFLADIGRYISAVVSDAWEQTIAPPDDADTPGFGPEPERWLDFVPRTLRFSFGRDLIFPQSIDPMVERESGQIECDSTHTIRSQSSNLYTQITVPGRPDLAQTSFYPGTSDDPAAATFLSTLKKWEQSEVSPARSSTSRLNSACTATGGCRTEKVVMSTE